MFLLQIGLGMAYRFTVNRYISTFWNIGIGKSQDRSNIGYRLSALAKYRKYSEPIKYRLSVIGFGQISVIGYRLNLTDMPSLDRTTLLVPVNIKSLFLLKIKSFGCMYGSTLASLWIITHLGEACPLKVFEWCPIAGSRTIKSDTKLVSNTQSSKTCFTVLPSPPKSKCLTWLSYSFKV